MTKVGEKSGKPAKPAKLAKSFTSKKEKSEDIREVVDWVVNDFAKNEEYFHKVIGLPNVGKIPKDITTDDVPLAQLEKHFGVKAKNDKNGYKKEGVLGIPADDIQKLVIALDGIEKFQFFSLEVARGLYYERILKRAVNWVACGVDKHKGQLAWRLRRNAPAQADLPPWKRVEHTYTMPVGLELTVIEEEEEEELTVIEEEQELTVKEEEQELTVIEEKQEPNTPVKSSDQCETPGGGRKASDVAPTGGSSHNGGEPLDDSSAGKARNLSRNLRRASDVAITKAKLENESECPRNAGRKATDVIFEMEIEQGTLAKSTPLLPCEPVQEPSHQGTLAASTYVLFSDIVQSPIEQAQPTHAASKSLVPCEPVQGPVDQGTLVASTPIHVLLSNVVHAQPTHAASMLSLGQQVHDADKTGMSTFEEALSPDNEDCQFSDNAGSKEVQTLETITVVTMVKAPEVTAPEVIAPEVTAPEVTAPLVTAPAVTTPLVIEPLVTAPMVETIAMVTPPMVTTPMVTTPHIVVDSEVPMFDVPDNVGSEEVQTLETIAMVTAPMVEVPKITIVGSQVPMFDVPTPKQKGCNELPLVPGRRESYCESWLQIVEGILEEVSFELDKAHLDRNLLKARMKGNKELLLDVDKEARQYTDTMAACQEQMSHLRKKMERKVVEIQKCETDMLLPHDDDLGIENEDQYLALCAEANAMDDAILLARSKYDIAKTGATSLFPNINQVDEARFEMQDEMDKLKQTEANLAKSHSVLRGEFSRLKQVLGKGPVHVRPVGLICPLQSEERLFPITECPICSLGLYCNNWVPTPCGHCCHPNCLFSLLQINDNRAPKCKACSEVFHPHWLECWGLPGSNHPDVAKLVDDWGLEDQTKSFRLTLTNVYSKNGSGINTRRMAQDARHKKATKLYSQEIIKKSIKYHETIGRAELVKYYEVLIGGLKGDHTRGHSNVGEGSKDDTVRFGTVNADNSPCLTAETGDDLQKLKSWPLNLSSVKKEKGVPELGSTVECISSTVTASKKKHKGSRETAKEGHDEGTTGKGKVSEKTRKDETVNMGTTAKKRKGSGEIGKEGNDMGTTVQSPSRLKLRRGTLAQTTPVVPPSTMTRRSHPPKK